MTHEPDIAQYAKRMIVFKDGLVVEDHPILNRVLVPGMAAREGKGR
jgi:ABC-type lipoprotein export system ATPase subunit